jgi:lipopolysaccharide export system ATP-binding protein
VEIARALALEPKASFCSTNPSPASIRSPSATSRHHHATCSARGIGVLITDHNVRETLDICETGPTSSARATSSPTAAR